MRFLIDANLPRVVVGLLRELGHQVDFARDIGLGAVSDEKIAAYARENQAILLTRDLDFGDSRHYPPSRYAGIVVLRVADDAVADDIAATLERFLLVPEFIASLPGRLAIVEPARVRFRPPLK